MRAVVHDRYGPPEVLRLEEVERPVPEDDEVLVRIHATTVNRTDCRAAQRRSPFISRFFTGLRRPKRRILGMELAGEVEAVGAAVTEFEVGDEVFGVKGFGAHAEFVCVRESAPLAHKPAGMTFEEAAAVCDGASIALPCLRKAGLREGTQHPRLRRLRIRRHRRRAAGQALRRRRHRGLQHEERRAACASLGADRGRSTTRRRTSRRTARPTTSSSTPSASTRSGGAGAR